MWNVKTEVISVIRGATESITKSSTQYPSNNPEKYEFEELQKTATLGNAHILRKVKVENFYRKKQHYVFF
jgi:hypothetical protein